MRTTRIKYTGMIVIALLLVATIFVPGNVDTASAEPEDATVTYKIINGTWDGIAQTVKTENVAIGSSPTNIPVPKADPSYGVGSWDTDPATYTVTSMTPVTFTYSYVHYPITYHVPDATVGEAPAEAKSWWQGDTKKEVLGASYGEQPKSKNDYWSPVYMEHGANGSFWLTDPNDPTSVADYSTQVTGPTNLYSKWRKVDRLIEDVKLNVTAKAGNTFPKYLLENDDLKHGYITTPSNPDYEMALIEWDPENYGIKDNEFIAGKTYKVRVGVAVKGGKWINDADVFFKGWTQLKYGEDYLPTNPEKSCPLTVNGKNMPFDKNTGAWIDNAGQTMLSYYFYYTVPTQKLPSSVGKTTIRNTIANTVVTPKYKDVIYDAVPGATSYDLAYKHKNSENWVIKNVGNTVRGKASGLTVKQLYQFKVRARKAETATHEAAVGAWSEEVYRYFFTVQKIRLKSSSKGSFTMSWNKDPDATGYQVMFSTYSNGKGAANNINTVGKNATSFTKKGLKSGKTYYVQVRALKKVGKTTYIGNISCPVAVKVR